jgi:general secretion pathway protein D
LQASFAWSGPAEAKVGDVVELKLTVNAPAPVRGVPMAFQFSKERLQLIDVVEGDFFRQGNAATSFSKSGDGKDGKLSAGVLRTQASGASGQGAVLTLRFKVIAAGAADVRLTSAPPIALGAPAPPAMLPPPFVMQAR